MTFKYLMLTYGSLWIYWHFGAGPRVRGIICGAIFCATGMWINELLTGKPGAWENLFGTFLYVLILTNPLLMPFWRLVALTAYIDRRDRY